MLLTTIQRPPFLFSLLCVGTGFASWRSLAAALGDRVFEELEGAYHYGEAMLGELAKVGAGGSWQLKGGVEGAAGRTRGMGRVVVIGRRTTERVCKAR